MSDLRLNLDRLEHVHQQLNTMAGTLVRGFGTIAGAVVMVRNRVYAQSGND